MVRDYGTCPGVFIANDADAFVEACSKALAIGRGDAAWLRDVDRKLAGNSWDLTFGRMDALVQDAVAHRTAAGIAALAESAAKAPAIRRPGGRKPYDTLIVGAGFAGSVLAERLASSGERVFLCDKRPHVGGNAYDFHNEAGILIHKYGPHIFHTNSEDIFRYLSRFTEWRAYEHRVLVNVGDKLVPMPINRTTLNSLYGLSLNDDAGVQAFLAAKPSRSIRSSPPRMSSSRAWAAISTEPSSKAIPASSGASTRPSSISP